MQETAIEMACKRGLKDIFEYLILFGFDDLDYLKNFLIDLNKNEMFINLIYILINLN